jgi:hypothetical protein
MTLRNAYDLFENLVAETSKKSEIKVYRGFIQILNSLEKRDLSASEIQSIEVELDALDLNSTTQSNKTYFKKALSKFEKYLKETFSLTTKGHYTHLYTGLGLSFGVLFGAVFLSNFDFNWVTSVGMMGGMFIGSIIGRHMDSEAVAEGRVL